jgi:hypothetical protein
MAKEEMQGKTEGKIRKAVLREKSVAREDAGSDSGFPNELSFFVPKCGGRVLGVEAVERQSTTQTAQRGP